LVEPGVALEVGELLEHVARRADAVDGGGGAWPEDVVVTRILEDARRAAIEEHGELLQLLGDGRDTEAAPRRHIADHGVDAAALDQVAEILHDLARRAGLVDEDRFDLGAGEALAG